MYQISETVVPILAVGLSDRFLMALSMDGGNSVFSKVLTVLLSLILFLLSYVFQHSSADKEIIPETEPRMQYIEDNEKGGAPWEINIMTVRPVGIATCISRIWMMMRFPCRNAAVMVSIMRLKSEGGESSDAKSIN